MLGTEKSWNFLENPVKSQPSLIQHGFTSRLLWHASRQQPCRPHCHGGKSYFSQNSHFKLGRFLVTGKKRRHLSRLWKIPRHIHPLVFDLHEMPRSLNVLEQIDVHSDFTWREIFTNLSLILRFLSFLLKFQKLKNFLWKWMFCQRARVTPTWFHELLELVNKDD